MARVIVSTDEGEVVEVIELPADTNLDRAFARQWLAAEVLEAARKALGHV